VEWKCLIVSLYVDDLIFTGNNIAMFERFKNSMKQEFDMSDLGRMKYFLGVEVVQNSERIFINQRKYANEVLERFGMKKLQSCQKSNYTGFQTCKRWRRGKCWCNDIQANGGQPHVFDCHQTRLRFCGKFNQQIHGKAN
jgi:hypothetical protein